MTTGYFIQTPYLFIYAQDKLKVYINWFIMFSDTNSSGK